MPPPPPLMDDAPQQHKVCCPARITDGIMCGPRVVFGRKVFLTAGLLALARACAVWACLGRAITQEGSGQSYRRGCSAHEVGQAMLSEWASCSGDACWWSGPAETGVMGRRRFRRPQSPLCLPDAAWPPGSLPHRAPATVGCSARLSDVEAGQLVRQRAGSV